MQEKNKRRWAILFKAIKTKKLALALQPAESFSLGFIKKSKNDDQLFEIDFNSCSLSSALPNSNHRNKDNIVNTCEFNNLEQCLNGHINTISLQLYPPNIEYETKVLTGFNNTGNVKIWPSEEILTKFMVEQFFNGSLKKTYLDSTDKNLQHLTFLELGGGYSSMASLFLAKLFLKTGNSKSSKQKIQNMFKFYLTDGNDTSVAHCQELININGLDKICQTQVLRWGEKESYVDQVVDYLLVSDCFFFDEFRQPLKQTIIYYLDKNPNLKVHLFGPSRNGTFQAFLNLFKLNPTTSIDINSQNQPSTLEKVELQPSQSSQSKLIKGNYLSNASSFSKMTTANFDLNEADRFVITELTSFPGQEEVLFCEIFNNN